MGLPTKAGITAAKRWNFSWKEALPVTYSSGTPQVRITHHL